jgi:hypothetical protein
MVDGTGSESCAVDGFLRVLISDNYRCTYDV